MWLEKEASTEGLDLVQLPAQQTRSRGSLLSLQISLLIPFFSELAGMPSDPHPTWDFSCMCIPHAEVILPECVGVPFNFSHIITLHLSALCHPFCYSKKLPYFHSGKLLLVFIFSIISILTDPSSSCRCSARAELTRRNNNIKHLLLCVFCTQGHLEGSPHPL